MRQEFFDMAGGMGRQLGQHGCWRRCGVELHVHERRLGVMPRHVDIRIAQVCAGQPLTALLDPAAQQIRIDPIG